MASLAYIFAALICFVCAVLLLRSFFAGRHRLLLWSGLCLLGLSLTNLITFADLILLPHTDLYPVRLVCALVSMLLLLYGLVWEGE